MFKKNKKYEVLTDSGFQDFSGIMKKGKKETFEIELISGKKIEATKDHYFYEEKQKIQLQNLKIGDSIDVEGGKKEKIKNIKSTGQNNVMDLVEVDNGNKFISNGVVTKNCDELAFVKKHIQTSFWASIFPTISTGGEIIISSTPNGDSDLFSELWFSANSKKGTDFNPIYVPWDAPPGRDEKFKQDTIGTFGQARWDQEYECKFITLEKSLFDLDQINERIEIIEDKPAFMTFDDIDVGEVELFLPIMYNGKYVVGVDISTGVKEDYSVIQVFDFPNLRQVMEIRSNEISTDRLYAVLKKVLKMLESRASEVYYSFENNGLGESMAALIRADDNDPIEQSILITPQKSKNLGVNVTGVSKYKHSKTLERLFAKNNIELNSETCLQEMKTYKQYGHTFRHDVGATDDCITAILVIVRMLEIMSESDQYAYHKLYTSMLDNSGNDWAREINNEDQSEEPVNKKTKEFDIFAQSGLDDSETKNTLDNTLPILF